MFFPPPVFHAERMTALMQSLSCLSLKILIPFGKLVGLCDHFNENGLCRQCLNVWSSVNGTLMKENVWAIPYLYIYDIYRYRYVILHRHIHTICILKPILFSTLWFLHPTLFNKHFRFIIQHLSLSSLRTAYLSIWHIHSDLLLYRKWTSFIFLSQFLALLLR